MSLERQSSDKSGRESPHELIALVERVNEHVAQTRRTQSPTTGRQLAPHSGDDLIVDRGVVEATLEALRVLGYRIQSPAVDLAPNSPHADDRVEVLGRAVEAAADDLSRLLAIWHVRARDFWARNPQFYRILGERMLRLGAPFIANEIVTEGLEAWPEDLRLRQLSGLSLAKSGAIERANLILEGLKNDGHADEETLGTLARTHKELGALTVDPLQRQHHWNMAYQLYARAFRNYSDYWTGINAATMAMLLEKRELSQQIARAVQVRCIEQWEQGQTSFAHDFWLPATLGETSLLLERWSEAEQWYGMAAAAGRKQLGDLISTRRQARLILRHLERDPHEFDRILQVPRVAVFAGHMIDRPNRARPRFPSELEESVARAIHDRLIQLDCRVGYSSAACGSDILFLEAVLGLDGEAHVVLPYDQEAFLRNSVRTIPGAGWEGRYAEVLKRATSQVTASSQEIEVGNVSYDYANRVLHGLATIRAAELEADLIGLAVWDGRPGDGPGGTESVVEQWRQSGLPVERIDLDQILKTECPRLFLPPSAADEIDWHEPESGARVMALLFADAVHYSKLTEEQVPRFVQYFLGAIGELIARSPSGPVARNTWGDGLYFVFDRVRDAGVFALDLCDLVNNTPWAEKRLPANLNLRIALHAGPVYRCDDPITRQVNYIGTHVSRAARIEPITPPGCVYASQAFAASAAVEKVREFSCEYVKLAAYAKDYGTFPTYLVKRSPVVDHPRRPATGTGR